MHPCLPLAVSCFADGFAPNVILTLQSSLRNCPTLCFGIRERWNSKLLPICLAPFHIPKGKKARQRRICDNEVPGLRQARLLGMPEMLDGGHPPSQLHQVPPDDDALPEMPARRVDPHLLVMAARNQVREHQGLHSGRLRHAPDLLRRGMMRQDAPFEVRRCQLRQSCDRCLPGRAPREPGCRRLG